MKGKHLQVSERNVGSMLTEDTTKRVYGRGTGKAAATETLSAPPKRPPGHNTIGIG